MQILTYYKKYLTNFKNNISILIITNIISLFTSLFLTYLTGRYVDLITTATSINWISQFTLVIFCIGLLSIVLKNLISYYFTKTQTNIVFKLNSSILKHVKKLPLSYFQDMDIVYLNQRINADTNSVINFIISILVNFIIQIVNFISITLFLFNQSVIITLFVLFSIPIFILSYLKFRSKLYETSYKTKEEQGIFFSHMHNQLSNIKFTKINVLFDKLDKTLIQKFPTLLNSILKSIKYSLFFSSTKSIIEHCFNIFLFLYGGIQVYNNNMTIGSFLIIKSYYSLLLNSISSFVEIIKQYPDTLVSHNRIVDILKLKQEHNGVEIINTIDTIKLDKLSFSYGNNNVLKDFSYIFKKGNVYLINGDNGAGKSTLIDIILGLHMQNYKGNIYYNNINMNKLDLYFLREHLISTLEQEPLLIDLNIEKISSDNMDDINIKDALYWIDKLKLNYINISETEVSGGEKQKIALVNALTKDAEVILMDEPTSALDKNSIHLLKDIIRNIKINKIIIIISHDGNLKSISDHIIEM